MTSNTRTKRTPLKLADLTPGEKWIVLRRRLREPQRDTADRLGITLYSYRQIEAGAAEPEFKPKLGALRDFEACHVLRLRAGFTLRELADEVGLSAWWVCQMEYGRQPADPLVEYWRQG